MTPSATTADRERATSPLTREKVIERLVRWAALYGAPPTTADWNPSVARWRAQGWRAERYRLGDPETGERWPSTTAAKRRFDGSFDAALRAAGFVPHRSGPRSGADDGGADRGSGAATAPPRRVRVDVGGVDARGLSAAAPRALVRDAQLAARAAEGRAQAAERERARQQQRAERAEARATAARRRARVLADRARRATAARDRARLQLAAAQGADGAAERALREEAETRVRAADDRAGAAARDAQRARGLASASVREAARLREGLSGALRRAEDAEELVRAARVARADTVAGEPLRPSDGTSARSVRTTAGAPVALQPAQLEALRAASAAAPGGPAVLAGALRALAQARATNDPVRLAAALADVAAAAVGWRERL